MMTDVNVFDDDGYLNELISFIKEYEYLFKFPNKDIFKSDVISNFEQKWQSLCKLSETDLKKIPNDKTFQETMDPKLLDFLYHIHRLSILKSKPNPNDSNVMEIPKNLFVKMKKKKEYEIKQILPKLIQECKKVGIKTVIDIGCGTGNLIKILDHFGLKCIGIEANPEFCKAAQQINTSSIIINSFVTMKSISMIKELVEVHGPVALVSLHGCGDLQKILLQIKVSIEPSKMPLFTFGCCYHKRTNDEENGWAISETMKSKLKEANLVIKAPALRLACDRGIIQWSLQTSQQFQVHKDAVFNRAVIETVFPKNNGQRSTNRNLKGDLISTICEKHGVSSNERSIKEEELKQAFERFIKFKDCIQPFSMFQSAIQAPMETLILVDSALYLKENGHSADFLALFDVLQSPRNMCIISSNVV